ncbi:hypothetical protein EV421DRAFT_2013949 [Armillaria borealis]|uniref:MFS general substrate transporter n=1 Tax=Armillaria borealis TaxID=47425 RepID=A0AA39N3V2_9AGAR|nr:hypothetical protein EV421DRAFT_2013949 [Armillaria borealis]
MMFCPHSCTNPSLWAFQEDIGRNEDEEGSHTTKMGPKDITCHHYQYFSLLKTYVALPSTSNTMLCNAELGSLMMAYPTETQKGRFWSIFNLGGVVGASVAAGRNWKSTANAVDNGTCLFVTLKTDPMIILLFPMFFASNWFYTWQFSGFDGAIFNIRARGLNNVCYWISQIIGSILIDLLLDRKSISRRIRAYTGWTVLFLMYTRESVAPETEKMDIYDHGYAGRVWFYIFCGILDAMWQTTAYWLMGAMSNDPSKLAFFAGFYKSIQSAGAAGIWREDTVKIPYMNMFISEWALLVGGLVFALPMVILRIKNHTDLDDETISVHVSY